jgi:small ligand-binding sensory domain FIST
MNTPFRSAHARGTSWEGTARRCLMQLRQLRQLTAAELPANLGFLYVTDHLARHVEDILALFRAQTGIVDWVGTVGIGVCATGVEYHDEPAIVAMLADLPAGSFRVFRDASELHSDDRRAFLALVHADYRVPSLAQALDALALRTESGFLIGGLSSSRGRMWQLAGEVIENSLSGVALSSDLAVTTRVSQGCAPIGPIHTVTACDRNVIAQLNARPALDVFKEDIGELLAQDLDRIAGHVFAALPVPGSDTGDYVVRNLLGIDLQHKVIAVAEVFQPGARIMFCRRDATAAREDMRRMLRTMRQSLRGTPRGALYVSCLGRGAATFGQDSTELSMIAEALGPVPLVGFFANGEICHDRLYTYTGVLTVFN